jgi:hypothetical protein
MEVRKVVFAFWVEIRILSVDISTRNPQLYVAEPEETQLEAQTFLRMPIA